MDSVKENMEEMKDKMDQLTRAITNMLAREVEIDKRKATSTSTPLPGDGNLLQGFTSDIQGGSIRIWLRGFHHNFIEALPWSSSWFLLRGFVVPQNLSYLLQFLSGLFPMAFAYSSIIFWVSPKHTSVRVVNIVLHPAKSHTRKKVKPLCLTHEPMC